MSYGEKGVSDGRAGGDRLFRAGRSPFLPRWSTRKFIFPSPGRWRTKDWVAWQTTLEFVNPSSTMTAHVQLSLCGDLGLPLALDFGTGSGPLPIHTFSIPPGGTVTLRSTIASGTTVTGRATAVSDIPVTGTVLFRYFNTAASLSKCRRLRRFQPRDILLSPPPIWAWLWRTSPASPNSIRSPPSTLRGPLWGRPRSRLRDSVTSRSTSGKCCRVSPTTSPDLS